MIVSNATDWPGDDSVSGTNVCCEFIVVCCLYVFVVGWSMHVHCVLDKAFTCAGETAALQVDTCM